MPDYRINEYSIDNKVKIFGKTENFPIKCAFHKNEKAGSSLLVTFPGVDGSHNGYYDKYSKMAYKIVSSSNISVLRTSNPYISGNHWDINFNTVIDHLYSAYGYFEEYIFLGFSAGGSIIVKHAYLHKKIKHLLLINTAKELYTNDILIGLKKFSGEIDMIYGELDPNIELLKLIDQNLLNKINITTIHNCDHLFSGDNIKEFIKIPLKILL